MRSRRCVARRAAAAYILRQPMSEPRRLLSLRNLWLFAVIALGIAGGFTMNLYLLSGSMALLFGLVVATVLRGMATGELPFKGRVHVYDESPGAFVFALLSYVALGAGLAYFGLEILFAA